MSLVSWSIGALDIECVRREQRDLPKVHLAPLAELAGNREVAPFAVDSSFTVTFAC